MYILISVVKLGGKVQYYVFYNTKTDKMEEIQADKLEGSLIGSVSNCVLEAGRLVGKEGVSLSATIIEDGVVKEQFPTVVDYNNISGNIRLVSYDNKKAYVDKEKYSELRETTEINNEVIQYRKFGDTTKPHLAVRIAGKKTKAALKLLGTKGQSVEDNIEGLGASGQEETSDNLGTVESKQEEISGAEVYRQEEREGNLDYKELIFNLFPNDRVTITYDMLEAFRYKVTKVLESNMDSSKRVTLSKIYKTDDNSKYTDVIMSFNDETKLCVVQVLGQSDIAEKFSPYDMRTFEREYATWLRDVRYMKAF